MIGTKNTFLILFISIGLFWISVSLLYYTIVALIAFSIGLGIGRYEDIFTWLKDKSANQRYSYLVDRLLDAVRKMDIDETRELLVDFIYFVQGTTRYRPIRYVGDAFRCPISHEDLKTGDMILILPCGHKGKYENMKEWVDDNTSCPECRTHC